jgi:hypothetical protein
MLHLDGAALAYRRDEDRVELVRPSGWPPSERPPAWHPVRCWGPGCSSPCCSPPSAPSPEPPGRGSHQVRAPVPRLPDANQHDAIDAIELAPGGRTGHANAASARRSTSGSTSTRSTTSSCSPSTPSSTGSSTTKSGRTRPSRAAGPRRCIWARQPHHPDISNHRNPASLLTRDNLAQFQLADRGQLRRVREARPCVTQMPFLELGSQCVLDLCAGLAMCLDPGSDPRPR